MTYTKDQTRELRESIRKMADVLAGEETPNQLTLVDAAELLRALSRMVEGKSLYDSFGAPGSWGYDTRIGSALAKLYKCERSPVPVEREECPVDETSDADPGL